MTRYSDLIAAHLCMGIDRNGRVAAVVLPHCGVGMEAAFDFDTKRVHLLSQSGITAADVRVTVVRCHYE